MGERWWENVREKEVEGDRGGEKTLQNMERERKQERREGRGEDTVREREVKKERE